MSSDALSSTRDDAPCLGLIVPPADGAVPVEGPALYGDRVRFIARGLGLGEVSTRGYEEVIDRVTGLAVELASAGAQAISLMGTSLSFYRGAAFNDALVAEMNRRTGCPCTTMSSAIVRALDMLGIERVAVATAYIDEVNQRLADYLIASEIRPTVVEGLGITDVTAVGQVPTEALVALCERVLRAQPQSDGILISCGGLRTLEATTIVEQRFGLPVVSSSPAGFWDLLRVAKLDSHAEGHGRLFEQ